MAKTNRSSSSNDEHLATRRVETRPATTRRSVLASAALLAFAVGCDETSTPTPTQTVDGGTIEVPLDTIDGGDLLINNPGGGELGLESLFVGSGTQFFAGNRVLIGESSTPFETTTNLCDPRSDADTGTRTFELRHMRVPTLVGEDAGGFDLDGIDNAIPDAGGLGKTVEGCGATDRTAGVDAGANALANALASVLPISDEFDASLATYPARVVLTHWDGTADDPCIAVTLEVGATGATSRITGGGEISGGVVRTSFAAPLTLTVPMHSGTGANVVAPIDFTMRDVRVAITLDPSLTIALPGSYIGGILFFRSDDPAYDPLPSLHAELGEWANTVGYDSTQRDTMLNAFASARDLHLESNGSQSPCTGASYASTNRNAISLTLEVDSMVEIIIVGPIP